MNSDEQIWVDASVVTTARKATWAGAGGTPQVLEHIQGHRRQNGLSDIPNGKSSVQV